MSAEPRICEPGGGGLFFPLIEAEHSWDNGLRAVLYLIALLYLFLGVNIVSDKFVSSIEVITSKTKRVRERHTGRIVTVAVWNGTVANLTLMALGSSAPEILLAVVETVTNGFHSGELGPSTIVGSAAFNLFLIIAVCITAIPSPETRMIKETGVYAVTAAFSLFAYFWLVVICQVSSPDVVEVWEAVLTLLFLPVLVFVSYLADIGYFSKSRLPPTTVERRIHSGDVVAQDGTAPLGTAASFSAGAGRDPFGVLQQWGSSLDDGPMEIQHPAGVLSFPAETWQVLGGLHAREIVVPVLRRGGFEGTVFCKYRMDSRSAVPGYDYVATEGQLDFGHGQDRAFVPITLLPKRIGEHSDEFQLILEGAEGGVIFDPHDDGGGERCVLTVTIQNENDNVARFSVALRASRWLDRMVNMDSLRCGASRWYKDIVDAVTEVGDNDDDSDADDDKAPPSTTEWVLHVVSVPWKLAFSVLLPPASLWGGWLCFIMSLVLIGGVTTWVIDFAELFGCVTGIEDSITAITLVALGTSMPDLFASRCAACRDEEADASIVNVTGSNSVNVFLGIGLPWTMSAIYWWSCGATDAWRQRYGKHLAKYPGGAFVVESGDLTFGVVVFTVGALIAFVLIHLRRSFIGGELGGPYMSKVMSSLLLALLWLFYIGLSIWKVKVGDVGLSAQAYAIFLAVCVLENVLLVLGICTYVLQGRGRAPADSAKGGGRGRSTAERDVEVGAAADGRDTDGDREREDALRTDALPRLNLGANRSAAVLGAPPRVRTSQYFQDGPGVYGFKASHDLAGLHRAPSAAGVGRALSAGSLRESPWATIYGSGYEDSVGRRGPVSAISFTSAAMVCIAAQRFKRLLARRLRDSDGLPHLRALPRESSFATLETASKSSGSSTELWCPTPPAASPRGSGGAATVSGRVADYMGRHAADLLALSAAGLAAAQLVDPQGAATILGAVGVG